MDMFPLFALLFVATVAQIQPSCRTDTVTKYRQLCTTVTSQAICTSSYSISIDWNTGIPPSSPRFCSWDATTGTCGNGSFCTAPCDQSGKTLITNCGFANNNQTRCVNSYYKSTGSNPYYGFCSWNANTNACSTSTSLCAI